MKNEVRSTSGSSRYHGSAGTLAMAAGSPNTNATVSHGGGHSSSASSKSAGLNVNAGTITNKTTTGIKNNGQNGSNGITVSQGTSGSNNAVGFASDQQIKDGNSWAVAEKVFEINAGIPLYRVTGDPALVGYSPLMPAQQLQATDANGSCSERSSDCQHFSCSPGQRSEHPAVFLQ